MFCKDCDVAMLYVKTMVYGVAINPWKWHLYTWSKNNVISSVRKHYCALAGGLVLGLELGLRSVYTERDRGFAAFAKEWSK